MPPILHEQISYQAYFGLYFGLCVAYFFIFRSKRPIVDWRIGVVVAFFLTISSPIILQTDFYRYLWDGFHVLKGINPYRMPPAQDPWFSMISWAQNINHPEVHSIYPPIAQVFFALTMLTSLKFMTALLVAALIYLNKHHRWDLLACHPLFLTQIVCNAHVDIIVLVAMTGAASSFGKKYSISRQSTFLGLAILSKWYPIIFWPFFACHWQRNKALRRSLTASSAILITGLIVCAPFYLTAQGKFFSGFKVFAEHWLFFGFIHGWLKDLLSGLGFQTMAVIYAKGICVALNLVWYSLTLWAYTKHKVTLRLALLIAVTGFLAFSPTIHPWYTLILLVLGLPYLKTLVTPWLWPLLSFSSFAFYFGDVDPFWIRYLCYSIVSICIVRDGWKIFAKKHDTNGLPLQPLSKPLDVAPPKQG